MLTIGTWARNNRDAIDPLAAIGALGAAVVLAAVTGFLWRSTGRLATSTEDLAVAAREQSLELKLARALTKRSLDLQEKQFDLADRQCNLAEKQHGLQRDQYLAEHRPRVSVRSIGIAHRQSGRLLETGQIIRGSLVIANVGGSPAQIRRAEYRFCWVRGNLPMAPPLAPEEVRPLFGSIILPHWLPGHESCLLDIESDRPLDEDASIIEAGGAAISLYLIGAIEFADADLRPRWMGFCRKYVIDQHGTRRFVPIDNPDYEYED